MTEAEKVRSKFIYDAEAGALIHRGGQRAGRPAGSIGHNGYWQITFRRGANRRNKVGAHRLIWLYIHGVWPDVIDHINHDVLDNRIENLRSVSRMENQRNRSLNLNNKSGATGVCWSDTEKKWVAQIKTDGVIHRLGSFVEKDAAIEARADAEIDLGFHPNHGMRAHV